MFKNSNDFIIVSVVEPSRSPGVRARAKPKSMIVALYLKQRRFHSSGDLSISSSVSSFSSLSQMKGSEDSAPVTVDVHW